jgi:type 1 glutamine amidotransferase
MKRAFTIFLNSWRKKRALILQGGWPGHHPEEVSAVLAGILREEGFEVEISETLDVLLDRQKLRQIDLIVPNWTMGEITGEQLAGFLEAVENGTGVAGLHGGMGDAFRGEIQYQLMTGGQFLAHPGNELAAYKVEIVDPDHPIMEGIQDFAVTTEQYYMMTDPANHVLAVSRFTHKAPPVVWREVTMPLAWIKQYGKGRVFYNSLGHSIDIIKRPEVMTMMRRGMVWASRQ